MHTRSGVHADSSAGPSNKKASRSSSTSKSNHDSISNSPAPNIAKVSGEDAKLIIEQLMAHINNIVVEKDRQIKNLADRINCLEDKVDRLEQQIDAGQAEERLNTLVVSFVLYLPQGAKDEDSRAVVVDMLKHRVNLNININDISTAHRLGAPRSGGPDKRSIIFKSLTMTSNLTY